MDAFISVDEITNRAKSVTLFANDATEEVFLTEIHRVLAEPKRGDRIKVTRADGESYLTWRMKRKSKR